MFLESLLETSAPARRRRGWATLMSFLLEATAISLLILVPMLYTNALPSLAYAGGVPLLVPPRGDPGPKPAGEDTAHKRSTPQRASNVNADGKLQAPHQVPPEVWKPKPGEDFVPGPPSVCVGCIPGSTGDGPANPVITNVVGPPPVVSAPQPKAPVPVTSSIIAGLLLHRVEPVYPRLAIMARVQGPVLLRAIIGRDGTIRDVTVESGHPLLVEAAVAAVRQWRYRPYILNHQPVDVETQVTVNFVLSR